MRRAAASVVITGMALATGLGDLESAWRGLLRGQTAIAPVDRFDTTRYASGLAACAPDLRPLHGSRLFALLDRLCADLDFTPPTDALPIAATTKAGIDALELWADNRYNDAEKDHAFAACRPDVVRSWLARRFGLADTGYTVNAACASSTMALARAAADIAAGRATAVLVCCADLVSEFVFAGFSSLRTLSTTRCRPFDRDRDGLNLGDGAALLLLMEQKRALRERRPILGRITGWAATNDATHVIAPAANSAGIAAALRGAQQRAGLAPEDVAALHAHGAGTRANDAMELAACNQVFGPNRPRIHSIKGALGHTLGAAGGVETALSLRSLATGLLPPTVGCRVADPLAAGRVCDAPLPLDGAAVVTCNSGFGGVNVALALERA